MYSLGGDLVANCRCVVSATMFNQELEAEANNNFLEYTNKTQTTDNLFFFQVGILEFY